MTNILVHLLLALEYSAGAFAVLALTAGLGRRLEKGIFVVCLLLPVVFLLPAFALDRTPLPVDHAMNLAPWSGLPHERARNGNLNDIATQMLPWNEAVRLAGKEGALPWRDRWNGCGTPLAANAQSAPFSPFTLLGLTLPIVPSYTLTAALKLFLCLTGMWLWLRELDVSSGSALFGSVSFSFSLTMMPWLFFPHTAVLCLWPWSLFAIERLRGDRPGRPGLLLTAIFTVWLLAGHPESVLLAASFTVFWLAARGATGELPQIWSLFGKIAVAAAIALGLSAFLLIPQAAAILASNRFVLASRPFWSGAFSWKPHGPFWNTSLFTAVYPRSLGDSIASPMIPGGAGSFSEMGLAYFGIVGWAAALLILRPGSRRPRAEWTLLVPAVFGWGAAVALWPFVELAGLVPALKMMFPLRFLSWSALAGSAAAAFELDRLRKDLSARRFASLALSASAALLAAFGVFVYLRFRKDHAVAGGLLSQRHAFAASFAVLAIVALAGMIAARSGRVALSPASLIGALTVLAAGELLYQGARLYRFESPAGLFPETPLLRFLNGQRGLFRVAGADSVLFPNTNVFAGLEDIRTHDAVERRDYVEFLDATCGYPPKEYFKTLGNLNAAALGFLNVRFLLASPGSRAPGPAWTTVYSGVDGTVFESATTLSRVFVPGAIRYVPDSGPPGELLRRNANASFGAVFRQIAAIHDWSALAFVLSPSGAGPRPPVPPAAVPNGRAEIREVREAVNRVWFRSLAPAAGPPSVAVASIVDDGGWRARDESGHRLAVSSANGPFLAVALPAGDHFVCLRYRPPGLSAGTVVSGATLFGMLAAVIVRRRRCPGRGAVHVAVPGISRSVGQRRP